MCVIWICILAGAVSLALQSVLEDPGFQIKSPLAANAIQSAKCLQQWSQLEDNREQFHQFSSQLVTELETALSTLSAENKRMKVQREKMWGQYHLIRSSAAFRDMWFQFLQPLDGCTPCPIFYQFITDHVFRQLIEHHCSTSEQRQHTHTNSEDLTYEEISALRYAAGYVCRAMRKEFNYNPEVLAAIDELIDVSDGEEEGFDGSSNWVKLANRGGLVFVKDTTYMVFYAMELVVRKHFCKERVEKLAPGSRALLTKDIHEDDDVKFYTSMLFATVEDCIASLLLQSIIKLWVTMRGFSFASSWIELYKQNTKKSLQRSKGLRKTLFTD